MHWNTEAKGLGMMVTYEPSTHSYLLKQKISARLDGSRIVTSESPSPMQGKL